ncbi:uncharacterized protein LOC112565681 [Pomacea canaliculata]|uniref:uncharacterized protein LOC112565681 n=1 Tax=Pomacea canaliculata TaxID=400727 RepID=UPI000D73B471|nr:uncharacterized protein LOC112565681 [Pomacea canaliculata]XP_025097121.1 uncharacterized protein LOC112565681 [Pomacea canaliculata]
MCTLATPSSYRGVQGFQVRRVLQAKVSDNLASRGISTKGLWDTRPSHKLSPEEQRRLERQRENKRNWARKEREKSKKRLEELKMTNCQLEYHNKKLKSEIDKLRRGHFELKTLLKDHDCRRLNHVASQFVPTRGVLLSSSHPSSELGLGQKVIETGGQQVVIVCSATSNEKDNDQGIASSAGRRRAKSESAVFMVNEGSAQKHYQKRVSWPAESVTYFVVEDDSYFEEVALETSVQLTGDEDIADDESVDSGGFATVVGNGEVGESVEVSGGGFLHMLNEDGIMESGEVSANETIEADLSDPSHTVFIQELNPFVPKIPVIDTIVKNGLNGFDTLVVKGAGNSGSGVEIDDNSTSQQVSSNSRQVARALSYPLTDTEGFENRSNCQNMLSRRLAMAPWCVSEDLNGFRRVQKQLSEGSESGTCHSSVSLGIKVVPPSSHCPKEAEKQLPKTVSWRHDASEASAAKRPRFSSLPKDSTLPELIPRQEGVAEESDRGVQTIVIGDHVYHVNDKDGSRSAANETLDSDDEIDTNFRPVGRLIPARTTPSTPSTPSSTDSTVPTFSSSASPTLARSFSEDSIDSNG